MGCERLALWSPEGVGKVARRTTGSGPSIKNHEQQETVQRNGPFLHVRVSSSPGCPVLWIIRPMNRRKQYNGTVLSSMQVSGASPAVLPHEPFLAATQAVLPHGQECTCQTTFIRCVSSLRATASVSAHTQAFPRSSSMCLSLGAC